MKNMMNGYAKAHNDLHADRNKAKLKSEADAVDSERPISLNIFADVWLVDR